MNKELREAIELLENEARQLENWVEVTRSPMGWPTRMGQEMIVWATTLRSQIASLKARAD